MQDGWRDETAGRCSTLPLVGRSTAAARSAGEAGGVGACELVLTPLPSPPPQGGREQAECCGTLATHRRGCGSSSSSLHRGRRLRRLARPAARRRAPRILHRRARPRGPAAAALSRPLEGRWRLPVAVDDVDPRFFALLFAYEDKRFRSACRRRPAGAAAGARFSSSRNGRIVSGGSTLTMQVARLLEPRTERTLAAKLRQMVRAIAARAHAEQGRNPHALSQPRALWRQSRRHSRRVARLFRQGAAPPVARRGRAAGGAAAIARSAAAGPRRRCGARARATACSTASPRPASCRPTRSRRPRPSRCRRRASPMPALAPHAADQAIAAAPERRAHRLTIDANLQRSLEELARERARALRPETSRSRSWWSTMRPARCWPASPRPTISTRTAPARST